MLLRQINKLARLTTPARWRSSLSDPKGSGCYTLKRPQLYTYFLIVDFEATCDRGFNSLDVQEIIEFPVFKINSKTLKVESVFHEYVRPVVNPSLTPFCTSLTGIVQEDVNASPTFKEVLVHFEEWCKEEIGDETALAVTCGDWDLATMLPEQCALDSLSVPECFRKWHNIKMAYFSVMKTYCSSLEAILKGLQLQRFGRPHCGIDDCENIKNVLKELIRRGVVFVPTKKIVPFS